MFPVFKTGLYGGRILLRLVGDLAVRVFPVFKTGLYGGAYTFYQVHGGHMCSRSSRPGSIEASDSVVAETGDVEVFPVFKTGLYGGCGIA